MKIYEYPCSVCQKMYKWSEPNTEHGKTCPHCRKEMLSELFAWGEIQEKDQERHEKLMDKWWNGLPKDVQEKAFYSVVKRLTQYECKEDLTYRQVLDRFGFDGSGKGYYLGLNCGFMELHNCIAPHAEMQEMRQAIREKKNRESIAMESFRIKSKCDICGYQSMDIYPNEHRCCPMIDCNGKME